MSTTRTKTRPTDLTASLNRVRELLRREGVSESEFERHQDRARDGLTQAELRDLGARQVDLKPDWDSIGLSYNQRSTSRFRYDKLSVEPSLLAWYTGCNAAVACLLDGEIDFDDDRRIARARVWAAAA